MIYLIRPRSDGAYDVVNIRTGQVHYTGSLAGARNAQATLQARAYV